MSPYGVGSPVLLKTTNQPALLLSSISQTNGFKAYFLTDPNWTQQCLGEGYWLSFTQRLPISYEVGDCLYGLMHQGCLLRDKEDAEGEIAEDAVEEEVL